MATITSLEESDYILRLIDHHKDAWLGASDKDQDGVWEWVTGEAFSFTRWGVSEPNGGAKECYLHVWAGQGRGGQWNDSNDSLAIGYILEIDPLVAITVSNKSPRIGETLRFETTLKFGANASFYQWFKNGVPIAGANSPELLLSNFSVSNEGQYSVNVIAGTESGISAHITVAVQSSQAPTGPVVPGPYEVSIDQTDYFVELLFNAQAGVEYRLPKSADLSSWQNDSQPVYGEGQLKFLQPKYRSEAFYRVVAQ